MTKKMVIMSGKEDSKKERSKSGFCASPPRKRFRILHESSFGGKDKFRKFKHRSRLANHALYATNKNLKPVEVFLCCLTLIVANFDREPTADSEMFSKMHKSIRKDLESKALMKSFTATSFDPEKPERFVGYMAPSTEEISKDIFDEDEDVSYSWVQELIGMSEEKTLMNSQHT